MTSNEEREFRDMTYMNGVSGKIAAIIGIILGLCIVFG